MSNKIGNYRPKRQTKSERLHDMCNDLVSMVGTLGDQQIKLHEIVMQATAQINALANIVEVLKQKGLITDEEIKDQIQIQNAKQDEGNKYPEGEHDRSEESGSNNEVHTDDSQEEPKVSATES